MDDEMSDVKPYTTDDSALAAYLYTKGMTILGSRPNPENPDRQQLIFVDEPRRKELVDKYTSGLDEVSASKYFVSYKSVVKYIHQSKRN